MMILYLNGFHTTNIGLTFLYQGLREENNLQTLGKIYVIVAYHEI